MIRLKHILSKLILAVSPSRKVGEQLNSLNTFYLSAKYNIIYELL